MCIPQLTATRKLRILCLHGFRQNFKGGTTSLTKKLKNMAEFVFVNAPHELPFIYRTTSQNNFSSTASTVPREVQEKVCLACFFKELPR